MYLSDIKYKILFNRKKIYFPLVYYILIMPVTTFSDVILNPQFITQYVLLDRYIFLWFQVSKRYR